MNSYLSKENGSVFQGETSSEILLVYRHHLAMAILIITVDDAQCEKKDTERKRERDTDQSLNVYFKFVSLCIGVVTVHLIVKWHSWNVKMQCFNFCDNNKKQKLWT